MECKVCNSLLEQHLFHTDKKCHQNKTEKLSFRKYPEGNFKTRCAELSLKKRKKGGEGEEEKKTRKYRKLFVIFTMQVVPVLNGLQMIQELDAHLRKHLVLKNTMLQKNLTNNFKSTCKDNEKITICYS